MTSLEGEKRSTTSWCSSRRTGAAGRDRLRTSGTPVAGCRRTAHPAGRGPGAHLRARRRDDLPIARAVRPRTSRRRCREPDRVVGPGHRAEGRTTAAASCASSRPGTARRPRCGSTTSTRRCRRQPNTRLAHGEVDVQPGVLGDGAAGPDPGDAPFEADVGRDGARRGTAMSETIAKTLDLKGLSCPMPIVEDRARRSATCSRRADRVPRHRPGLGAGLQGVVHDDGQRARRTDRGRTGVFRFVIRKKG